MTFTVGFDIEDQRVEDLLCCALEGGSGYWCCIVGYEKPTDHEAAAKVEFRHLQYPFMEGGAVILKEEEDEDAPTRRLDREALERGLKLMAQKYPRHWKSFMEDNEDADTGDVFLQLAVLGEIVYG